MKSDGRKKQLKKNTDVLTNIKLILEEAHLKPIRIIETDGIDGFRVEFDEVEPISTADALLLTHIDLFIFYANYRLKAQNHALLTVSEFLSRANHGLNVGNFEMDFSTGEIRYKSSIDFQGSSLSPILIRNVILSALDSVALYTSSLLDVLKGNLSPTEAIEIAEVAIIDEP